MRTQNFIPHFSTVSVRMNFQGNKCLQLSFKETQNLAFSTFLCNIFISQTNILIKPKNFLKYFLTDYVHRNCGDFVTFTSQKLREINAYTHIIILRCCKMISRNIFQMREFCAHIAQCGNYAATILSQKFREINFITKELYSKLI